MKMELSMGPLANCSALRKRLADSEGRTCPFRQDRGGGRGTRATELELPIYALALYEIDGPGTQGIPREAAIRAGHPQSAAEGPAVRMVGRRHQVSVQAADATCRPMKPVDDGHGHATATDELLRSTRPSRPSTRSQGVDA